MELPVLIGLAAVVALLTLVLCDLAGSIARAKARSYWLFFALGLLLWFPALIAALALADRSGVTGAREPGRVETAVSGVLVALAALAAIGGLAAAVAYAP